MSLASKQCLTVVVPLAAPTEELGQIKSYHSTEYQLVELS